MLTGRSNYAFLWTDSWHFYCACRHFRELLCLSSFCLTPALSNWLNHFRILCCSFCCCFFFLQWISDNFWPQIDFLVWAVFRRYQRRLEKTTSTLTHLSAPVVTLEERKMTVFPSTQNQLSILLIFKTAKLEIFSGEIMDFTCCCLWTNSECFFLMLPFSSAFKILNDHTVTKYLYVNRIGWPEVIISIQWRIGEKAFDIFTNRTPVPYDRVSFTLHNFLDRAKITEQTAK